MTDTKWTTGPWELHNGTDIFGPLGGDSGDGVCADSNDGWQVAEVGYYTSFVDGKLVELGDDCRRANRHLIAAAPELYREMERYLPVLERAEANPEIWAQLTEGLGIATANGYRHKMAKARDES